MSITTRLQKVTQGLSPLQRISLVLQALRDGRDADPDVVRIDDPQEKKAFNRYIALLYCANVGLAPRCHGLSIVTDELERAAERVRLLEQAAGVLEEDHGLPRPRRVRDWRKSRKNMQVNEFLRSLAREMRTELLADIALRWQELRAVELLWDEIADEVAGEDPVGPETRAKADEVAALLESLAKELGRSSCLVEPDAAMVAEARETVDQAFKQLEPLL